MRIYTYKTLREFWRRHPDAEQHLRAWHKDAKAADWDGPAKIRVRYPAASILPGNRVVFNINGNAYRLIVMVNYASRVVYIRFIGTHAEYDRINAAEV